MVNGAVDRATAVKPEHIRAATAAAITAHLAASSYDTGYAHARHPGTDEYETGRPVVWDREHALGTVLHETVPISRIARPRIAAVSFRCFMAGLLLPLESKHALCGVEAAFPRWNPL